MTRPIHIFCIYQNTRLKYLKKQMIFSPRHYCNRCLVQRPINLIASGPDCYIPLQHFEEASEFETTRISAIRQFSNFLKLRLFSESLLKIVSLIYFMVSEINILTKFR